MRIGVLGGGISGLASAYQLRKKYPDAQIHLFEKEGRIGGVIGEGNHPFFFEKGPRTFSSKRHTALLSLIQELNLPLLYAEAASLRRFIFWKNKLRPLPQSLREVVFSRLGWIALGALFKDATTPLLEEKEETVGEFARRRFGSLAASLFFDPLVKGIYGAKMDSLSVNAAFPRLKQKKLVEAIFSGGKGDRLFSVEGGLEVLLQALVEKGKLHLHLNTAIESISPLSVQTGRGEYAFDLLVCALPASALKIIPSPFQHHFHSLSFTDLAVVQFAFKEGVDLPPGYGYLLPSIEEEGVLGALFDSRQFPSQNKTPSESRISYMVNTLDREEGVTLSIKALSHHLGIEKRPDFIDFIPYPNAVPLYGLGHKRWAEALLQITPFPLVGNYLEGVSVNNCIDRSFLL